MLSSVAAAKTALFAYVLGNAVSLAMVATVHVGELPRKKTHVSLLHSMGNRILCRTRKDVCKQSSRKWYNLKPHDDS